MHVNGQNHKLSDDLKGVTLHVPPVIRCAIYTRKSDEKGMDQRYHSIAAQNDYCLDVIEAHKKDEWQPIAKIYSDVDYSGGNMNRPGLQELLKDVRAGLVNKIVVYKTDRLSRDLRECLNIMAEFQDLGVQVISATEEFMNCADWDDNPDAELSRNINLCFNHTYRRKAAKVIRDKIAKAKSNGYWMGGPPPLGYNVRDRQLFINKKEAEVVRFMFEYFLETQSTTKLLEKTKDMGLKTKAYVTKKGNRRGGEPFKLFTLYSILKNPLYNGKIKHQRVNALYEGKHKAIIDDDLWQKVQAIFAENSVGRRKSILEAKHRAMFSGYLICEKCMGKMSHVHSRKRNKLYTYYVCDNYRKKACDHSAIKYLPAACVDRMIMDKVKEIFRSPKYIHEVWEKLQHRHGQDIVEQDVYKFFNASDMVWDTLDPGVQEEIIALTLDHVLMTEKGAYIHFYNYGLGNVFLRYQTDAGNGMDNAMSDHEQTVLFAPYKLVLFHGRTKIIEPAKADKPQTTVFDKNLIDRISDAFEWYEALARGEYRSINHLAEHVGWTAPYVRRILKLRFLDPEMIEKILAGQLPSGLSLRKLTDHQPVLWHEQKDRFGFNDI